MQFITQPSHVAFGAVCSTRFRVFVMCNIRACEASRGRPVSRLPARPGKAPALSHPTVPTFLQLRQPCNAFPLLPFPIFLHADTRGHKMTHYGPAIFLFVPSVASSAWIRTKRVGGTSVVSQTR